MVRNRSWPAVSHICNLTRFPSNSIVRILKSMPIVVMKEGVNESSLKRSRQQDLPTPESPISSSLICIPKCQRDVEDDRRRLAATCAAATCDVEGAGYQEVVVPVAGHLECVEAVASALKCSNSALIQRCHGGGCRRVSRARGEGRGNTGVGMRMLRG